jgi:hypothetical protein
MNVLTTAYTATRQRPAPILAAAHQGACARCATSSSELSATRTVVSKTFTGFDGWADPSGPGLCPACTWAYRTPALRQVPHEVTTDPSCRPLTRPRLRALLAHPLPTTTAVVVPLRPGRKHLLATAQWGRVTTDDATLTWTSADTDRLAVMARLRAQGFGPRMLLAAAPTWPVLVKLAPRQRLLTQQQWPLLAPWRRARPWFDLAVHASAS